MAGATDIEAAIGGDAGAADRIDTLIDRAKRERDYDAINEVLDPIAGAAAGGDEHALALLVGLVDSNCLAHGGIRRILLDPDQIEDAAQETLLSVVRGIGSFEGRSSFSTWLFGIALNSARQMVRRDSRRPQTSTLDDTLVAPSGVGRLSSIVSSRADIEAAIASLPDQHREILTLREIDQLSYDEIADHLGVGLGTVKSRLARAREQAASSLGADR